MNSLAHNFMPVWFDKAVRYLLIVALFFNAPYAALHAVEHMPLAPDASHASSAHAHSIHEHGQSPHVHSFLKKDAPKNKAESDNHFCHACQLSSQLSALIPNTPCTAAPILATPSAYQNAHLRLTDTTRNCLYIRGPPVIF